MLKIKDNPVIIWAGNLKTEALNRFSYLNNDA